MKRAWGAALAVLIALAMGLAISLGGGDDPRPVIAYISGSASAPQVWVSDFAGHDRRSLGPGQDPLVAPNGAMVAASAPRSSGAGTAALTTGTWGAGTAALTIYGASGGAPHRFFNAAQATAVAEAWSPDSHYVAAVLRSTDPASDVTSGLAVIDTGDFHYRVVAHGPVDGASFAPDGSDRIVYASDLGQDVAAPVDLHVATPDGTGQRRITFDGRSLNPVWESDRVVFDHESIRPAAAPAYQLWSVNPDGGRAAQLTRVPAPQPLLNGLVPVASTATGGHLLAEYEGQDTSAAWEVGVRSARARPLAIDGQSVVGAALSRNGALALVDFGGFLNAPDQGTIETVPLGRGSARVVIRHGSQPSWDR